jgi:hypothetical protein
MTYESFDWPDTGLMGWVQKQYNATQWNLGTTTAQYHSSPRGLQQIGKAGSGSVYGTSRYVHGSNAITTGRFNFWFRRTSLQTDPGCIYFILNSDTILPAGDSVITAENKHVVNVNVFWSSAYPTNHVCYLASSGSQVDTGVECLSNEWHKLTIDVNNTTHTFSAYLDSVLIINNVSTAHSLASVQAVYVMTVNGAGYYLDDVEIDAPVGWDSTINEVELPASINEKDAGEIASVNEIS